MANAVVDELIKERLKTEKLIEYSISISDEEYLQREKTFFDSISLTKNRIIELFKNNNINYNDFKNYL